MKKLILLVLGALSALGANMLLTKYKTSHTPSIHYHAGFVVYIDGVKQEFADYKYMNFTPCSEHNTTKSPEEEQVEKAHLHDMIGDVVHVHRDGAKWKDLITNMRYTFPEGKSVTAYNNGQSIADILNQPIVGYDSVVFVVGEAKGVNPVAASVPRDHILEVEGKSELCGASD